MKIFLEEAKTMLFAPSLRKKDVQRALKSLYICSNNASPNWVNIGTILYVGDSIWELLYILQEKNIPKKQQDFVTEEVAKISALLSKIHVPHRWLDGGAEMWNGKLLVWDYILQIPDPSWSKKELKLWLLENQI